MSSLTRLLWIPVSVRGERKLISQFLCSEGKKNKRNLKNELGFEYIIVTMNGKVHTHPLWICRGGALIAAETKRLHARMREREPGREEEGKEEKEKKRATERGEEKLCHIHLKTQKL